MVEQELINLIDRVMANKCEEQVVEVKAAHDGCPEKLYDTISAFANQNSGGTMLFGLDEQQDYKKVGVYDAQDLQKKVMEYGEQMTPVIRPLFTVHHEGGLTFVAAEIPPIDIVDRPCFKTAKGRLQGSFVRVGDADKRMTEYEVYSYEAFRKKYRDDIRPVDRARIDDLEKVALEEYLLRRKKERPNLSSVPQNQLYELTGVMRDGEVTLAAVILFGIYPQAFFPQLGIIATAVPGTEIGVIDSAGRRFSDTKRIEGTLTDMLNGGLAFVRKNMKVATIINTKTGEREDIPQYPLDAVREALLNALVHRDYSIHTEGMPIQLIMYSDRIEIRNPGGLYGRITVDQLGHVQPDTRNPVLATAMEVLDQTENRYSGIPRIRRAMQELSLPEPVFSDKRGEFTVCLYNQVHDQGRVTKQNAQKTAVADEKGLINFCRTPKTRQEILDYLAIKSGQYALRRYLDPLVVAGAIVPELPDKPRSSKQRYYSVL